MYLSAEDMFLRATRAVRMHTSKIQIHSTEDIE